MSQWRGRLEDNPELESAADWFAKNYQFPVVALLIGFMLWSRLRSWRNFIVDGEVLFLGHDAWYHYRTTVYAVENWPANMPFDPWTYFPYGNASGQFGTLFDQIMATVALGIGLGNPSHELIAMIVLVAPPFFAAAAAIPTYFVGRRLGGRASGITAVAILAFSVGSFYSRSRVGFYDHHVAEALFSTLGILCVMVAVSVAQRDKPIYEQIIERDFENLRPTLLWGALAGFAISLYLWVWPFGILFIVIVGAFLFLQMNLDVVRGKSPEHTAFVGAVALGVTAITLLTSIKTLSITAGDFSLLQPLAAFLVATGAVFMAWLARKWEQEELSTTLYPIATVGIVSVLTVFVATMLPETFQYVSRQVYRLFGLGFVVTDTAATVGEAQPLVNWEHQGLADGVQTLFDAYGFAIFIALIGAVLVFAKQFGKKHVGPEYTLVLVWAVVITAATFSQIRFQYYLVFPVAVLTGFVVSLVVEWVEFDPETVLRDIEIYQVLVITATVLIIFAPILPTAVAASSPHATGPGDDVQGWSDGLDWMNSNTPEVGEFNGSESNLEIYGTYERQDDYEYAEGDYGVLSWWDYGHYITVLGERIPTANPFQQGANSAANFLLSPDEAQANEVLDELSDEEAETRYIMIDHKMVDTYSGYGGKFFAPTQFYDDGDVTESQYTGQVGIMEGFSQLFRYQTQDYYETTMVRLYHFHGSAVETEPIVLNWDIEETEAGQAFPAVAADGPSIQQYDSMEEAREAAATDDTAIVGGFGGNPSERVPAMENYRIVGASEMSASETREYNRGLIATAEGTLGQDVTGFVMETDQCSSDVTVPARSQTAEGEIVEGHLCLSQQAVDYLQPTEPRHTKIFERVPGATVEGTGPTNATVTAQVEMEMPESNETFIYRQVTETDEDGAFEMTVPYSTTGYDEWGTETGHTNVSVQANSSYQIQTLEQAENGTVYLWEDSADVTEGQVIGQNSSATTVEMERSTFFDPDDQDTAENETATNETNGEEEAAFESDSEDSDDDEAAEDGTDDSETEGETSGSLVAPVAD